MTQRILAIVGPDRCGKTNIADELERLTCIKKFKASSEHHTFLKNQKSFINDLRHADPRVQDFIKQMGVDVIFDRGWPCEHVYSRFFGRKTDMKALKRLDSEYAKMGAQVIVCTRKSFAGIKDDLNPALDELALRQLSSLYEEFVAWTQCKTYTLFVDDEDLTRETNEIMKFMNIPEGHQQKLRYWADHDKKWAISLSSEDMFEESNL